MIYQSYAGIPAITVVIHACPGFRWQHWLDVAGIVCNRCVKRRPDGTTDIEINKSLKVVGMYQAAVVYVMAKAVVAIGFDR